MAYAHVEQKTLLKAAYENGFITDSQKLHEYEGQNCISSLKEFSTHSLTTDEYLTRNPDDARWIRRSRNTTVGPRSVRLPAGYLKELVEGVNSGVLTTGKAAELAMMDRYSFLDRFGDLIQEPTLL